MKQKAITKDSLATLILLYNYLSNKSIEISMDKVDCFYNQVSAYFDNNYHFIDDSITEKDFNRKKIHVSIPTRKYYFKNHSFKSPEVMMEKDYLGIDYDNENYMISDINLVIMNYKCLPIDIINYSLSNNLLEELNINKNDLMIDKDEQETHSYVDFNSLSKECVRTLALQKLVNNGFYDIKINDIISLDTKHNYNYRVYYDAKKIFEKVDVKKLVLNK